MLKLAELSQIKLSKNCEDFSVIGVTQEDLRMILNV